MIRACRRNGGNDAARRALVDAPAGNFLRDFRLTSVVQKLSAGQSAQIRRRLSQKRSVRASYLGTQKNLAEAQALGAKASSEKADRVVSDIADVLGAVANYTILSAAEIVDLLNAAGLRSGRGLP